MRIRAHLICYFLLNSFTSILLAQNPGAQQDAEAAREKLLKAADQLDNIQANSEATKTAVDNLKTDITKLQSDLTQLQTENAALKQQLAETLASLDQFKAEQIKARQTLIDNVAGMIAAQKNADTTKPARKKKETTGTDAAASTSSVSLAPSTTTRASNLAPPPDALQATTSTTTEARHSAAPSDTTAAPPKPQKGYYHVVADGETLKMICTAYRENGVNVTLSEIRKANGLTEKSVLKTGQKLFIPKPGT